jgi:predicted ATPase
MINPITKDRLFVITGGPGSGKTTLIEALASKGLARYTETYAAYGYSLVPLPLVSVEERVEFVTKEIFS